MSVVGSNCTQKITDYDGNHEINLNSELRAVENFFERVPSSGDENSLGIADHDGGLKSEIRAILNLGDENAIGFVEEVPNCLGDENALGIEPEVECGHTQRITDHDDDFDIDLNSKLRAIKK
ncbi:hypothetical protein Dsin_022955 [Dipteronia sinensis]|uniref:Uncharacterized protein n=1 Tax=Dipteronia sinensis TaxID=43782 RepID=A0AAE0E086_9ROSI|nr:hypothetical protein Dsin_022955 [Dipteronia sinensis]